MKRTFVILSFILSVFATQAQSNTVLIGSKEYKSLKASGQLSNLISSGQVEIESPQYSSIKQKKGGGAPNDKTAADCFGYYPPNTPSVGLVNDDQSVQVNLNFTFCFYGTNYTSLWINDNGTVSFDAAHGTFTASGFPFTAAGGADEIIAPFWADFHQTGALSGQIHFENLADAIIIHWNGVGYFAGQDDKLNTMMLILTDGTSPLLQPGANVGFFYDDMQWTTGSASGGTNGFGGTAATVGANKGDGINYVQFGRFDGPGTTYDGPFTLNDSVSWLDNKSFMFDICSSSNIPPVIAGIDICDTLRICFGDTFPISASFLAPEINQLTSVDVDTSLASGFQITNIISGTNTAAQVDATFFADSLGAHVVHFTVYDNAVPPDTIEFDYIIFVDTMPFTPIITGDTIYCPGDNVILDAGANFDSYLWNNADITQTTTVTQGSYSVTATIGGCSFTTPNFIVTEHPTPIIQVTGDTIVCTGDSVLLNATTGFDAYLWSTSATDTLDSVYVSQGTYTVTVTDTNTCSAISTPFTVQLFPTTATIIGANTYCLGDSVLLDAGPSYDSYLWNTTPPQTTQTIYVTQGTYTVDITLGTCNAASNPHIVTEVNVPKPVITGELSFCTGGFTVLDADSIGAGFDTFSWDTSPIQTSQTINVSQPVTITVIASILGCANTSIAVTVVENPLPTPTIVGNLFYCANDSNGTTLATANSYASHVWSNLDLTPTSVVSAGPISVIVTDANGCQGTTNETVTMAAPSTNISGVEPFCVGSTIVITADAGFNAYLWDSGEQISSINAGNGSHTVTVTDNNGCTAVETLVLTGNPTPSVSFTINPTNQSEPNQPVIFTDESTISSGNITSWIWNFDVANLNGASPFGASSQGPHTVTYTNQGPLTVTLEVISNSNCPASYTKDYLIVSDIIIPNVFTPNGDGSNDFLVFTNLEFHSGNKLTVLNRWGGKVYETESYKNDWDGGGQSEGTYFYVLTVNDLDDPIKGTFILFK